MLVRTITKKDYKFLLELDKKVYPTESPVTSKILDNWYKKNPEFGIMFTDKGKIKGMLVAIPLNKLGWTKLITGKLAESDLDAKTIFDNARDKELGMHIYHIEKFEKNRISFYKDAFKALSKLVNNIKKSNPKLRIIGFSALCVTSQGIGLFYNKLNFRERSFINNEHILLKNQKKVIVKADKYKNILNKLEDNYEYQNRCKMLVLYPNEVSILWKYF